jgi:hypothetical protein
MLSGTVDNAFTHRGKRKQSPATATNTTPIGFALDRPDEDTALTLAALRCTVSKTCLTFSVLYLSAAAPPPSIDNTLSLT